MTFKEYLRILSDEEIEIVHNAAIKIMENTGVFITPRIFRA